MCGDKYFFRHLKASLSGSPPHVRGQVIGCSWDCLKRRITPACAGTRGVVALLFVCDRDHPRMCGDKRMVKDAEITVKGSPPHVRGQEIFVSTDYVLYGITPACAGTRPRSIFCLALP